MSSTPPTAAASKSSIHGALRVARPAAGFSASDGATAVRTLQRACGQHNAKVRFENFVLTLFFSNKCMS